MNKGKLYPKRFLVRLLLVSVCVPLALVIALTTEAAEAKDLLSQAPAAAFPAPGIDAALTEPMELVGAARMQVLFWDVYDARLFAPGGRWSADRPYALSLVYLRELQGEKIAARSIEEIREQGFDDELTLARWYEILVGIIPDVAERDEIVGVADDFGHTRFYLNGELIGEVPEPEFTDAFFAIWLGTRSSAPELRAQLLGEAS
jgi:hypothetical protein